MKPREWYRIEAKASQDVADVYIYDQIGKSFFNDEAVTAAKFITDLQALPSAVKTIRVHVNSPGGSVFEASAIANALRAQRSDHGRTIQVRIDGIAASAATIVTSAGKPVQIAENAMVMVHEPSAIAMGPSSDMRKMADTLDSVRDSIIAAYRWISSKSVEDLGALMAKTTWMTAQQAVDNGFAHEIVKGSEATACITADALAVLGDVPDEFRARVEALVAKPEPAPEPAPTPVAAAAADVLRLCREADCLDLAEGLVQAGATLEDAQAQLTTAKATRAADARRAAEIRALCETATVPEFADDYIAGAMPVALVRAQLTRIAAIKSEVAIDGGLDPDHGVKKTGAGWTQAFASAQRRFGATRTH